MTEPAVEAHAVRLASPDVDRFRMAMGSFATGVTVVTSTLDGEPYGMTVNAFTSVSLEPPLILVCLRRGGRLGSIMVRARAFAVSVLREDQAHLARYFANPSRHSGPRSFGHVHHERSPLGNPLLRDGIAHVDCALHRMLDGGDHVICLGEVRGLGIYSGHPLTFFRGKFGALGPSEIDAGELLAWPWV